MILKRYAKNPILAPNPKNNWESQWVLNCGIIDYQNRIHMLYRAVGSDRISRLGLAISEDGYNFARYDNPVMEPANETETLGVEDPRITRFNGKFYVAYTGYASQKPFAYRLCLASTEDFLKWERYGIMVPDVNDKDGAIFPEKVNGKYVMFHRIEPDMYVLYSDDLIHWSNSTKMMGPRKGLWDGFKIGAGGPPIKTDKGWLTIYHGVDEKMVYRLGICLLDLNDPTRVISRLEEPILEPEKGNEQVGWVSNVVFSCGQAVRGDTLYVYYGGADAVICVATCKLSALLKLL